MFFSYIRDTFGNMFVHTKHSRILALVTSHKELSFVTPYQLSIEGVREGVMCPWSWACFVFLFPLKRVWVLTLCPLGRWKPPSSRGRELDGNKGTAPPEIRRHSLRSPWRPLLTRCSVGRDVENPGHQLSLILGCRNRPLSP